MGFDNECILNIQALPGEYFCPVCRTLIYPNEALQSLCTHLYCKPCLAYIVATTQACPYDGYLVTEADSKPLMESNKSLAETIGKVTVHCLYHRSGCQWQGTLSDCITHCTSCSFGNSPVVCNRCGTQIIHRQVQEHAQICPGLQPQAQQAEATQVPASTASTQATVQGAPAAVSAAPASAVLTAISTPAAPTMTAIAPGAMAATAAATASAGVPAATPAAPNQATAQTPTADQWYQQQLQYQQYYQQYPGYNPYAQYQQYGPQAYQQYMQPQMQAAAPQQAVQGQLQPSIYVQGQPPVQQHPQAHTSAQSQPQQPQLQPPVQPHLQAQPQAQAVPLQLPQQHPLQMQPQPQVPLMQGQQPHVLPPQQSHPQAQPSSHPPTQMPVAGQQFGQPVTQSYPPQPLQQPHPSAQLQPQHLQPPQQLPPHAQPQLQPHPASHLQLQPQPPHMQLQPLPHPHPQPHPQPQPIPPSHAQQPPAHAVTGHQSYPHPQPAHQVPPHVQQQRPMQMHPQQPGIPYQQPQMNSQFGLQTRPPSGQYPLQGQQQTAMLPQQGPHANVQPSQQQPHHLTGQGTMQMQQHSGIHPQAQQQGFPPQQTSAALQPGQTYQQGMLPPQAQMHPQQPMRPPGPPHLQQHVPSQPYSQPNALQGQSLASHQPQVAAGRPPIMTSHGMPQQQFQQSPAGPPKNAQPAMPRSSVNMGAPSELQPGGQGTAVPVSPASQQGKADKVGNALELRAEISLRDVDRSEASDTNYARDEGVAGAGFKAPDSESVGDEKTKKESKENDPDVGKGISESTKDGTNGVESNDVEAPNTQPLLKEGVLDLKHEGKDSSNALKDAQAEKETKTTNDKADDVSGGHAAVEDAYALPAGRPVHSYTGPHFPQQNSAPGALNRGQSPAYQNMIPPNEGLYVQPGPGSYALQGMGPAGSILGPEKHPPAQQAPYGHFPSLPDMAQRAPGTDRMFSQHMPHLGPTQDRRFPEPMPYHMQGHQVDMASNQMRPPGQAKPPGFDHFQPPPGQQPFGPFPGEVPARPPGLPQGPTQSHMPVPHPGGVRPQPEDIIRPALGGPPPRAFGARPSLEALPNPSGFFDGRQPEPPFIQPGIAKVNGMPGKPPVEGMHGLVPEEAFRGAAGEHHTPFPAYPGRHSASRREIVEDLKQFPRPAHLDAEGLSKYDGFASSSRPLDRGHDNAPKPFDRALGGPEGISPFPGRPLFPPAGFHNDFARNHDSVSHSDLLRPPLEFGRHRMDGMPPLRSPGGEYGGPPSGRFGLGGQSHLEDFDGNGPRGPSNRSKALNLQSDRIPGHPAPASDPFPGPFRPLSDAHGGLRKGDQMNPANLFGNIRKELDGPDGHFRPGDPFGARNFPTNVLGPSESVGQGQLRVGEPTGYGDYGVPGRMRHGDPGFGSNYSRHAFQSEAGHFNSPIKRNPGSMGWCRICSIDCETVEGLDLHSQTREHQKMAMDMVLSIKQEVAKKQKLNSEAHMAIDAPHKPRKSTFDGRGNRH